MTYLLSEFDLEEYGKAVFSDEPKSNSGEFRSARSMIPFVNQNVYAADFSWNIYGDHAEAEIGRKLSNAFVLNFEKFRTEGKGLYIHSATKGTGKTYLSFCLANELIRRYSVNVKFISVLDYLDITKKGYSSVADKEEKDSIVKATVLILDDIGVEVSREWTNTTLYQLINYRYLNKLITIITSNYPIGQLKVDDRIKSRVNDICLPLPLPEVSIREIKTDEANNEFMREVFGKK